MKWDHILNHGAVQGWKSQETGSSIYDLFPCIFNISCCECEYNWGWGWVEMEAFRKLLQQYLNWINQSWRIWVAPGRSLGGIRAPRFRFAFFGFFY